jgi:trk system potassium uptake protein TrkA
MLIVIAGCGRLGAGLAKVLSTQGHDVVVVAQDVDLKRLGSAFDGITVAGSPIDEDVLRKARIAEARIFVAATADDSTNVMAIQIAEEVFHVPTVLARISDPDREKFYRQLGLNTVCPTATGINQILELIRAAAFSTLPGRIDTDLVGLRAEKDWIGRTIAHCALPADRRVVGVVCDGVVAAADPQRVIGPDDTLIVRRSRPREEAP